MDLLPSEQAAFDFVSDIGLARASALLDAIGRRFDRRYSKACKSSFAPINREWIYRTALEVDLTHRLKIGLTLCDVSSTPEACRNRIMARRSQRKAERQAAKIQIST